MTPKNDVVLELAHVHVDISGKEILRGIGLSLKKGEIHAIMGPNGSGKSTLAMTLMGHPGYELRSQNVEFRICGVDAIDMKPEERARAGLFVSFQSPIELSGITLLSFLRTAFKELHPEEKLRFTEFQVLVAGALRKVGLKEDFMKRSLNEGFSGGERKRAEIAQLLVLKPKIAILDEIDSGLDVDSLKIVSEAIANEVKKGLTVLAITHYQRILHFLKPDMVHVLIDGTIKQSGSMSLVRLIEKEGYKAI